MSDNWDVGVKYRFRKPVGSGWKEVVYEKFEDGSAYISGDEEIIFEQKSNAWEEALRHLRKEGYSRVPPVSGAGAAS